MGEVVGDSVGNAVGEVVGDSVGEVVGDSVGLAVGEVVGEVVGYSVGETDGFELGMRLGASVIQRLIGFQMLLVPAAPGTFSALSHPFLFVHSQMISLYTT